MAVSISVPATPVTVAPGGSAPWLVQLHNPDEATHVRLWVSGLAAQWLRMPEPVWLGPGEDRQLRLLVEPPVSAGPVGAVVQLVLHAELQGDRPPQTAAAVVVLAARALVTAAFEQHGAVAVRRARLPVVVRSEGTEAADVGLTVSCAASCSVTPRQVVVEPGQVAHADVHVTAPLRWGGGPRSFDVRLDWTAGEAPHGTASTTLTQRALLQRGTVVSVLTTLAVAVLVCLLVVRAVR